MTSATLDPSLTAEEIKRLLLAPGSHEETPLFASQRELARRVAQRPGSRYGGKEKSLTVFLNQVLLGRKPCPADLKDLLLAVTREALINRSADTSTVREVTKELSLLLSSAGAGADAIGSLLVRQLKAKEVVVVNPDTLEGRGHPRSSEFQDAMFKSILDSEGRYTFVLDKRHSRAAERHWEATYEGLKRTLAADRDENDLEDDSIEACIKDLEEEGHLSVLAVEPSWCIIPLVAFDPGQRDLCEIFVWDWWLEDGQPIDEIAQLSQFVTWKWIEDFYNGVLRTQEEGLRPTPIRFADARDQVR